MRRHLILLAAVFLPGLAAAQTPSPVPVSPPRLLEGRFELLRAQPRCVRAPCPPHWRLEQGGQRFVVRSIAFDPATPAPVREGIERAPEFTAIRVEGSARIEAGEAVILARSFRLPARR